MGPRFLKRIPRDSFDLRRIFMQNRDNASKVKILHANGESNVFDIIYQRENGIIELTDKLWIDQDNQVWDHSSSDWFGEVIEYIQ